MGGSDQARRVRVMTDGDEVERHLVGFENDPGAADEEFADAAAAEAAADGQARSVAPRLQLQKATDHQRNVLGENPRSRSTQPRLPRVCRLRAAYPRFFCSNLWSGRRREDLRLACVATCAGGR